MMKKLEFVFNLLFSSLLFYITLLVAITMFQFSPIVGVVACMLLIGTILSCKKSKEEQKFTINIKYIWIVLQLLSMAGMLIMAFGLKVNLSWDWGVVMRTAAYYVESGIVGNPEYYAQYANNQIWLLCLIALFKIVKFINPEAQMQEFQDVSIVLMCLLIQFMILLLYLTAKHLWNEKKAVCVGITAILCLPLYLYAQFAYTDIPGMMLGAMLLYFYVRMTKSIEKKKYLYLILIGITGAAAFKIKIMVSIILIAIFIEMFLTMQNMKTFAVHIGISLAALIITLGIFQFASNAVLHIDDAMYEQNQFPATHWIMMGLNNSGGYTQKDVEYTEAFVTYEEKKAATIQGIKNRIKGHGISGMIHHVFITKMKRTWCVSTLNGDDYVGREMLYDTKFQKIFTKKGSMHEGCLAYTWMFHFLIIAGICISGIAVLFDKDRKSGFMVGRIAIFGVILFLSIWECNSRYLLCFIPVLTLSAIDGYGRIKAQEEPGLHIYRRK